MEFLRQYFWTILLLAIILVSLVIVLIFIFINICIKTRANLYSIEANPFHYDDTNLEKQENKVHHINLNEKPPLPPRDQFMSMESVDSYENVEPVPDYIEVEETTPPAPQKPIFMPDYTPDEKNSQDQDSEDYDDVDSPANCDSDEDYDDVK